MTKTDHDRLVMWAEDRVLAALQNGPLSLADLVAEVGQRDGSTAEATAAAVSEVLDIYMEPPSRSIRLTKGLYKLD